MRLKCFALAEESKALLQQRIIRLSREREAPLQSGRPRSAACAWRYRRRVGSGNADWWFGRRVRACPGRRRSAGERRAGRPGRRPTRGWSAPPAPPSIAAGDRRARAPCWNAGWSTDASGSPCSATTSRVSRVGASARAATSSRPTAGASSPRRRPDLRGAGNGSCSPRSFRWPRCCEVRTCSTPARSRWPAGPSPSSAAPGSARRRWPAGSWRAERGSMTDDVLAVERPAPSSGPTAAARWRASTPESCGRSDPRRAASAWAPCRGRGEKWQVTPGPRARATAARPDVSPRAPRRRSTAPRSSRCDPYDPALLLGNAFLPYLTEPGRLRRQLEVCAAIADVTPALPGARGADVLPRLTSPKPCCATPVRARRAPRTMTRSCSTASLPGCTTRAAARTAPGAARAAGRKRVVESGPLSLACSAPSWRSEASGRRRGPRAVRDALREQLGWARGPIEKALAAGYARWGSRLLDRLHGPFALVVWSRDESARPARAGPTGRPLAVHLRRRARAFSSRPRSACCSRCCAAAPIPTSSPSSTTSSTTACPMGALLFHGIGRLGGGCLLELSDRVTSSGATGRRDTGRRCSEPRADLAARLREELRPPWATRWPPSEPERTAAQRRTRLVGRGRAGSPARAGPEGDRGGVPRRARARRDVRGLAGWRTTPASHSPRCRSSARDPFRAAEEYLRAWQLPLPVPGHHHRGAADRAAHRLGAEGRVRRPGRRRALRRDAVSHRGPSAAAATALGMAARPPASLARPHPPLRHVWQVFMGGGLRGALPPGLHTRVRRWREPGRYAPAWLRPAHARQYRDTHDPWRWKRLDGPRWWASLADTLTRGRETADIADYLRRRGAHGRLGSPVAAARPAARRARPAHPTRDELRSGHIATTRAGGAARVRCLRRCLRARTSGTSRPCSMRRSRGPRTSSGLDVFSTSAARRSAPTSTFGDCAAITSIGRPRSGSAVGGRGR